MSTISKKKTAKEVKVGHTIKIPAENAVILSIKKIDSQFNVMTKGLLIFECEMTSGPFKKMRGSFVISGDEKIEHIRTDTFWNRAMAVFKFTMPYMPIPAILTVLGIAGYYV